MKEETQPQQSTRVTRKMRSLPPRTYVEVEEDEEEEGVPATEQRSGRDPIRKGEDLLTQVREMLKREVAAELAKRWAKSEPSPR